MILVWWLFSFAPYFILQSKTVHLWPMVNNFIYRVSKQTTSSFIVILESSKPFAVITIFIYLVIQ